jgi:hypothetical protein
MTWDEHYQRWSEVTLARRNAEANGHLETARRRVAENSSED